MSRLSVVLYADSWLHTAVAFHGLIGRFHRRGTGQARGCGQDLSARARRHNHSPAAKEAAEALHNKFKDGFMIVQK